METFGAALRRLRKGRGLSQQALALAVGCSTGYIGLIETGERASKPSLALCLRLADALRLTVAETECVLRSARLLAEGESIFREPQGVLDALQRDAQLSDHDRALLADIYQALAKPPRLEGQHP